MRDMGKHEDEEQAAIADKAKLKYEAEHKKEVAEAKLHKHNAEAPNGPDGAQRGQPLPDDVHVEANAEPTSKPQNTQKGKHVENG